MSIEADKIQPVADRLAKLYRQVMRLRAAKPQDPNAPLQVITFEEIISQPIRSRLESVDDAESGLEYAAWAIGETLALLGGQDLMHAVYDRFEAANDGRAGSWLDHRWSGIVTANASWHA